MALNIKDTETEKLAAKPKSMQEWLETEIWPQIPEELLDREPMSKEEVEDILGLDEPGDFTKTDLPLVDLSD